MAVSNALATLLALALMAAAPIRVSVYPQAVANHGTIRLRLAVDRHPDNRKAVVVIDNFATYYRSSDYQLDGDAAAVTQPERFFSDLPGGEYEVKATLYSATKVRAVAFEHFTVIGEF